MPVIPSTYKSPGILLNAHIGTLAPNFLRWAPTVKYERQRIELEDGDFVDLDWAEAGRDRAVLVLHGLGGHSGKPYMRGMAAYLNKEGWDVAVLNLRSCSGELNRLPRFYHGGDTPDLEAAMQAVEARGYARIGLAGFSLGGNILLRYLGELGDAAAGRVCGAVAISAPILLGDSAQHLSTGNRWWYMRHFVQMYRKRLNDKEKAMPGTFRQEDIRSIKSFYDFDSKFNAPWYGFDSAEDFYIGTSAGPILDQLRVPTLMISAKNDPFLPDSCYPREEAAKNDYLFLEMPEYGGHVGFMSLWGNSLVYTEHRVHEFLSAPDA